MANLLDQMIEQISREKHIEPGVIVAAIEDAMVVAARKYYKTDEDLRAKFNAETGQVDVYAVRSIVGEIADPKKEMTLTEARKMDPQTEIGGELLIPKPTAVLGRIAAQTAKQVIMQKVREAERDTIFNEYNGRVGELVNCIVKRFEGPDVIVDLGRTEARLPKREQSRLETYNLGDRLRVVIRAVDRAAKGPQVIVSRADPVLVQRLFEMEVPEIYDGTVQIRAAAREAGERTKIAVQSRDKDVDPVGACVGMKGMRVQSIIRELRGEKIDIIPYSEDTVSFAQKSLSPAKVTRVQIIDAETRHLEIIVEDTQLSLAIGKKGQNVRLASKLIGWNVDIKSEEEKRQEIEAQMAALTAPGTPLAELKGVGPKTVEKIETHGITSIERLADMTPEELTAIPGIGEKMVEKIQLSVAAYFQSLDNQQAEGGEVTETEADPTAEADMAANVDVTAESGTLGAELGSELDSELLPESGSELPEGTDHVIQEVPAEAPEEAIAGSEESMDALTATTHDVTGEDEDVELVADTPASDAETAESEASDAESNPSQAAGGDTNDVETNGARPDPSHGNGTKQ